MTLSLFVPRGEDFPEPSERELIEILDRRLRRLERQAFRASPNLDAALASLRQAVDREHGLT